MQFASILSFLQDIRQKRLHFDEHTEDGHKKANIKKLMTKTTQSSSFIFIGLLSIVCKPFTLAHLKISKYCRER